jgi:TDG/mug DNA glycosylase family protein
MSDWAAPTAQSLIDSVGGVKFSRAELEAFKGTTLPDLLGPHTLLLFVGINPGLRTVAVQAHFGKRGNRFYPALYRAGIIERPIDANEGMSPEDREYLLQRGIGVTNIVAGASARADELTTAELLAGARALAVRVALVAPKVVAILGITAYRIAFNRPRALVGRQPEELGGAQLWVVPNPSGLNAHATPDSLAAAYKEAAVAAGIL